MACSLIVRTVWGSSCVGEVFKTKFSSSLGILCNRFIRTDRPDFRKREERIWKEDLPKPGNGRPFRRIVHYPENYTVEPLNVTNLAGRDPVTGRLLRWYGTSTWRSCLSPWPCSFSIFLVWKLVDVSMWISKRWPNLTEHHPVTRYETWKEH